MWRYSLAIVFVVLAATAAFAQTDGTDGYIARPCGFDMNDDGVIGDISGATEGPDCNVCDGVTTDPDGDGDPEDLIYINCDDGVNTANCGTPGAPCLTIAYAYDNTSGSTNANNRADGNGDGNEDIFCARGICRPSAFTFAAAGVPNKGPLGNSYYEIAATWKEAWDRRYPADPAMLVAWDTDNDGEYPPYDASQPDPLILDGCATAGCTTSTRDGITLGAASNMELAHFTLANYRKDSAAGGYGLRWNASGTYSHHYVHDIVLQDVYRGVGGNDGYRVIDFRQSSSSSNINYIMLENLHLTGTGAWATRGFGSDDIHFVRFANITRDNPQSGGAAIDLPFKIWKMTDIDVIDSLFDGTNAASGDGMQGFFFNKGIVRGRIVSSTFKNVHKAIEISHLDDDAHGTVEGIVIDGNYGYFTEQPGQYTTFAHVASPITNGQERNECAVGDCDGTPKVCGGSGAGGSEDCQCVLTRTYLRDVTIKNNVWDAANNRNLSAFVSYQNGQNCANGDTAESNFGPLHVLYNTIKNFNPQSTNSSVGVFVIGRVPVNNTNQDFDWKYVKGKVRIIGNGVYGLKNDRPVVNWKRGDDNINPLNGQTHYAPGTDFFADYNIYQSATCATNGDCDGGTCASGRCNMEFRQGNTTYSSFSAWRSATGQEAHTATPTTVPTCSPSFAADGFHLVGGTCAENAGEATYCPDTDIDGDLRPQDGTCDIGADEVANPDPCAGPCGVDGDCNDSNGCTTDTCEGCPLACVFTNNTAGCDDGMFCTGADTCAGGTCATHAGDPCSGATPLCDEALNLCKVVTPSLFNLKCQGCWIEGGKVP